MSIRKRCTICISARPSRPPALIAASVAAYWQRRTGTAARPSRAIPSIRPISAGSVRRARRSARRLALDGRLLHPMVRDATAARAYRLGRMRSTMSPPVSRSIIERHGPDSVAFYLSGQLLTEDYYVANKLMKGFIGSANVDTNSRLCMASSVAGHRRAFGADTVPGTYEDLDHADLIVLVGSNAAWCHPVLFQRMIDNSARARRAHRRDRSAPHGDRRKMPICSCRSRRAWTPRCSAACLFIWPTTARSTDGYIAAHTRGFEKRLARAREIAPDVARDRACDGPRRSRRRGFLRAVPRHAARRHLLFARREPVGAGHRQGQRHHQLPSRHRPHRQAAAGAVLAHRPAQCHGRPRGRRTRQSACRAYGRSRRTDVDRVGRFWSAPRMAAREGRKAVADVRGHRARARSRRCG